MNARDPARLCSDFVRIHSENPPGHTGEVIHAIAGVLEGLGREVRILEEPGGRCNLLSPGTGSRLLLLGHVDTVPALSEGWDRDPFSGDISGGFVFGRGATDMKGGCASLISAIAELTESGEEPAADLLFVCDEETSGTHGIRSVLAQKLLTPRDCLIAEPTPARAPNIGQKGLCRLSMSFRGEPGHGSLYPVLGVSAVAEAFRTLSFLSQVHERTYTAPQELAGLIAHSSRVLTEELGITEAGTVLTRVMFNPGRIEGGEKANVVAQSCRLTLDLRLPWGCDPDHLIHEISTHSPRASVHRLTVSAPSWTPPGSRVVRVVCKAVEKVCQEPVAPILQWAASDARFLRAEGYPVIEYGPGDMATLHAVNERVPVSSLTRARDVYCEVITKYTNTKDQDGSSVPASAR